jgi:hypothetical protein
MAEDEAEDESRKELELHKARIVAQMLPVPLLPHMREELENLLPVLPKDTGGPGMSLRMSLLSHKLPH